jgi:hypothetical protein
MGKECYPRHIYEATRFELMSELLHKETIKLLPSLDRQEWEKVGRDIKDWLNGERSDLAPIHDFWNLAEGIMMGSKLKPVVRYVTAENITWTKKDLGIDQIDIMWPVGILEKSGELPYTASSILAYLELVPGALEENMELSDRLEGKYKHRDHYPVIALQNDKGQYELGDGNRRTLRAILKGKEALSAWVGDYSDDTFRPKNYWVGTGFLRELGYYAQQAKDLGELDAVEVWRKAIQSVLEASTIARINWGLRVGKRHEWLDL